MKNLSDIIWNLMEEKDNNTKNSTKVKDATQAIRISCSTIMSCCGGGGGGGFGSYNGQMKCI